MSGIKIRLPEKLPSEGLTQVKFKIWKSMTITYLQQSTDYQRFLPGGPYENWLAADENQHRIEALHNTDRDEDDTRNPARLTSRRTQLATVLSIIASISDLSQYNDIMTRSTSITWIWNLIETDADIQKKGRHFLKLDSIVYPSNETETPTAFYKRLRAHFTDNLRKQGELVKSRNDQRLEQDEKMSPTLENTIVYMALKSIDPRLPNYVEQVYGHRMDVNTTLYDLQSEIFQSIKKLIQELDSKDPAVNYIDTQSGSYDQSQENYPSHDPTMAATGQLYSRFPFRPRAPAGNTFRPRPPGQRFFSPRNQLGNTAAFRQPGNTAAFRPRQPGAGYVQKFCSLCRDAGLPARVYQAHNLTECYRLNRSTVTQLRSLVLDDNLVPEDYQEHYNDTAAETDYNFPAETAYYEEQNHQQQ